ncbi:MAG TPA: methylenetetrahydrofolate reductase [NAD(P)H] [Gammaproteobacteria bacterium]
MDSQKKFKPVYSFEFFPPKTPKGEENLRKTRAELAKLKPRFFSVPFGAGRSTRDRTYQTVTDIQNSGSAAAPHISCIASGKQEIEELLRKYQQAGINHLVALRGDMPSGTYERGDFRYANELVDYIRKLTGRHFFIEVAAYPEFHPQAHTAEADIENFVRKVKSGADSAITQYFYNIDSYFYFIERCQQAGVNIPVVPGIMPITNYEGLARFSDRCGAEIPRWIRKQLEAYQNDEASVKAFGIEVVTQLCRQLLDAGAPGLHFYTMNQAEPTVTIWKNLGL